MRTARDVRIDVLTIFPAYLDPLDLSLVGKARRDGILDLSVHDLRDWTADRHRTVDDTPFGGGAGMVMRPDVWGLALDDVLARGGGPDGERGGEPAGAVLLLPTPAGEPFTQRTAAELAGAEHLVVACGRYEGIDARVAEHYRGRPGVEVREVSIGDYVLNGGEVAALVLVEAVARLLPGVLGNPDSLVEESHGAAGLLEYPVYTKPPAWAGLEVPEVLLSGHHGKVARWRRDEALRRTAERRADLVAALDPRALDAQDRRVLARLGWFVPAGGTDGARVVRVGVRHATAADAGSLAELAARTFPLACPPSTDPASIETFLTENLSAERFAGYLRDPARVILLAEESGTSGAAVVGSGASGAAVVGYTMLVLDAPPPVGAQEPQPGAGVSQPGAEVPRTAELSKCYVSADHHGTGLADRLLEVTVRAAQERGATTVWLGSNIANRRAQRFYARHGFAPVGVRQFRVGDQLEDDVVMARDFASTADPVAE